MINPQMTVDMLNKLNQNSMGGHLGIEITEVGNDFIKAKMPVDHRTQQPFGLLHGGASAVLAETLGSIGATSVVDMDSYSCVGLEINTNHIKGVKSGVVIGTARPIHVGSKTQVWEIKISDEGGQLVSISRLTLMVLEKRKAE